MRKETSPDRLVGIVSKIGRIRVIWLSYGVDFTTKKAEWPKHEMHERKIAAPKKKTNLRGGSGKMLIKIMLNLVFISTGCASFFRDSAHDEFHNFMVWLEVLQRSGPLKWRSESEIV